jgi:TolB protein
LSLALALLVVPSFTLAGAGAGADVASGSASSGRIVFQSSRDGDYDIYAMNPDGTGLTELTHNDFEDSSPVPSPDGTLIAFQSHDGFTLINADGSGRRLLEGCGSTGTTWSPDSTRLVCPVEVEYDSGLAVVDVATGTSRLLARRGQAARWSPDGRTIAYVDGGLYVVPAEGGTRRRLGRHRLNESSPPSWSPDSQRLAYAGSTGSSYRVDLFTIRADGSGERRLVQRVADLAAVHWSPVGSLIVFQKELPHYVIGMYTVRANGTGMRRVGGSPGRESSRDPMWSADGTALLYARQRYRGADETDVFITVPNGGVGRALTRPFPAGGSNDDAHWTSGPRLAGGEPAPATIRLPLPRMLSFADQVLGIATDGRRAAPFTYSDSPAPRGRGALIWDAVARRTHRTPVLCGESGGQGGLVLAGKRLAWLCGHAGNTFQEDILMTTRPGARRPKVVADAISYTEGGGDSLENLVGHGNTIAFTHYRGQARERTAWLLVPTHGKKCPGNGDTYRPARLCRRLSAAPGGVTTAVDTGRVLTVALDGTVRLLSTSGHLRRTWKLDPGIVAARLRGRAVAVQHRFSVDVYDAVTGAKKQTIALAANEGVAPRLLDIQGDLAVYATGGAIHLVRLSDGKDRALSLPGGAPELDAGLERRSLFVSWNRMYSRRPGRVAFVSLRAVKSALHEPGP